MEAENVNAGAEPQSGAQDRGRRGGRIPFAVGEQAKEFQKSSSEFLREQMDSSLEHMVAVGNRMQLHHGRSWSSGPVNGDPPNQLGTATAEVELKFAEVASNDMQALKRYMTSILDQMVSTMHRGIYAAVEESTQASGNVVSAVEEGSLADAFLACLKKVEFGVDENGRVSIPSFHAPPGVGERLLAELESRGEEFRQEVARVREEKSAAALGRERERLEKYKK